MHGVSEDSSDPAEWWRRPEGGICPQRGVTCCRAAFWRTAMSRDRADNVDGCRSKSPPDDHKLWLPSDTYAFGLEIDGKASAMLHGTRGRLGNRGEGSASSRQS
mmetsp:Transcript_104934/g.282053  ORF Transcript_104934/g.282053 Transcript_104934/m.282053 type:complete len:104 (+) Transcript_104934:255-566(+)